MQISLDFVKDNIKNLKSWILILILTLIYFLIFNIAFFTYKANLSFSSNETEANSKLILINVLLNYVDWFLYFCIIPFLSFCLVNYLKKIKVINYFFEREAYKNLYLIKYITLWFLSSVIILLIITTSMQLLFTLFHFWIIGLKNSGFIFKIFIIKELILILYIPICFLMISSISIIFNKIIIIFYSLTFLVLSLMSILHLSLIQNTISNKKINYQLLDDYSKTKQNINFTFNEVNLISSITNNLIHQTNFANIKIINSKNELLLDDYSKYLLNYCDGSNTEILYVNQKIYPVCNVFDYKINDEYNKTNGINLIWKNLMRSEDFESIMGQITLWFQNQNNFSKGLEKINKTLKTNYQWDKNKIEELKFLVGELNFKNGKLILKISNSSDFQITLINNFFKDIFYFYLISYISNPLEFDEITQKSYIETFHSFLYFKEYETDHWINIFNIFLWKNIKDINISQEELKYLYSDFNNYGFDYFFKTNLEPSIYFNLFNTAGIDQEIAYDYNLSFKKVKTYQLLDASSYHWLIFNSLINVNKYQKSLLTSLNSNELMIKQLSNYNDIKFRISSNKITINQVKKSDSVNIIILILLVFLLTILLIFFIEFLSYLKYRILNNNFVVKNFVKDIFKYLKK